MNYFLRISIIGLTFLLSQVHISAQTANNPLPDCPKSPNCFASQLDAKNWNKKPLAFTGIVEDNIEKLLSLLDKYPGANHITSDITQIHYTFQTKVGKFIDDVYFAVDTENNCFHFRSASRKGYSDMGANKRRMKKIRRIWEDKSK